MIDITNVSYEAELVTESGTVYSLADVLLDLQWEEQKDELSQRASLSVAVTEETQWLLGAAKINCIVMIYGNWGQGRTLLFEGTVWDWHYESGVQKELNITAYDRLIRLQQCEDCKYYSPGMTTRALVEDICGGWGVPVDYRWGQGITHEKKVFSTAVSDMIIELLKEVKDKTGEGYVAYFRDGKLQIVGYGSNETVYRFDMTNTASTSDKLSINNLVTRVKVLGKDDEEGRAPVEAIVDGDSSYGVLQKILRRDGDKTIAAAQSEAETLLKERGKPEETIQIEVPDLPFLRKGDKVEVEAGNLIGLFFVEGVSHAANRCEMSLTLSRPHSSAGVAVSTSIFASSIDVAAVGGSETGGSAGAGDGTGNGTAAGTGVEYAKGDAVILNGPVYKDSYGKGKGKTFTNYGVTVTIVAPLTRPCPYHVGTLGWVYPDALKRG